MSKLIIMRSIPGGGKSFEVEKLVAEVQSQGLSVEVHSTDRYFMVETVTKPRYHFDFRKLGENHQKNQDAARLAMENGVDVVIIDNTNIAYAHFKPYVQSAKEFGYTVEYLEPSSPWWLAARPLIGVTKDWKEAEKLAKPFYEKGTHGVPLAAITKMILHWENIKA